MLLIHCDLWQAKKTGKKQSCHHKERGKLLKSVAAVKENVHGLRLKVSLVVSRRESRTWHAYGCDFDLGLMSVHADIHTLQCEAYVLLVDLMSLRLQCSWKDEGSRCSALRVAHNQC